MKFLLPLLFPINLEHTPGGNYPPVKLVNRIVQRSAQICYLFDPFSRMVTASHPVRFSLNTHKGAIQRSENIKINTLSGKICFALPCLHQYHRPHHEHPGSYVLHSPLLYWSWRAYRIYLISNAPRGCCMLVTPTHQPLCLVVPTIWSDFYYFVIIIIIEFCQKRANDKVGVGLLLVCSVGGAPFAVSLLALKIIMPKAQLTCFGEHFSVQHNKLTQHPSCNVSLPRERERGSRFFWNEQSKGNKKICRHPPHFMCR